MVQRLKELPCLRGEAEITPSMNLLVHGLMEEIPGDSEKVLGDEPEKKAA